MPCTQDSACFDGLVCGAAGVCVDPSVAGSTSSGDGDGNTSDGTGDGDTGDGDGDTGDGDGDAGDGDGDGSGDGDGETGDGDGDADSPDCGNGIREGNEVCDGTDLGGMTCADFGQGGGMLTCNDSCDLDLTQCCLAPGQNCNVLMQGACCSMSCNLMTTKCD